MKRVTYFALPVAVLALAISAVSQTPQNAPQLPEGAVGRYQLMCRTSSVGNGGLYRIDTMTGQTWKLVPTPEISEKWEAVGQK